MAYTLTNKCAKNSCKQTIQIRVILEDTVTHVLVHTCSPCSGESSQCYEVTYSI